MKVPEPKKLPSGNWNIRLRLGGREISITKPTAAECKKEAAYIKSAYKAEKMQFSSADEQTLEQIIIKYIEHCRTVGLSPSTIGGYENVLRNRFKGYMKRRVKDITSWTGMVDDELKVCSSKTTKNAWSVVSAALKHAKIPRTEEVSAGKKKKVKPTVLDPEDELPTFLHATIGHRYELEILLGLHSLRMSEILGLKWENIDLEKNCITVSGAIVNDGHGNMVYKEENKTEESERTVPIMIPRLRELLEEKQKSSGFVTTITHSMLARALHTICKHNDLPQFNVHKLRHIFASLCYFKGVPILVTMRLGGWKNPQVVQEIYTHLSRHTVEAHQRVLTDYFTEKYNTPPKPHRYKLKTPMKLPTVSQKP